LFSRKIKVLDRGEKNLYNEISTLNLRVIIPHPEFIGCQTAIFG
jgi:hypothetical protein